MAWRHMLHRLTGRERRLAAHAAGELSPAERSRLAIALAACPACRREVEAYRLVTAALGTAPRASLSPEEAAAFWPAVERRIRRGPAAAGRPARPSLREMVWDHPRLSLASAGVAAMLILGLTLHQVGVWGPGPPPARPAGAEVLSLEAGENASVMLFQVPGSSLKVIWIFEAPTS